MTSTSSLNFSPVVETTNLVNVELGADRSRLRVLHRSHRSGHRPVRRAHRAAGIARRTARLSRWRDVYPEFGVDDVDYAVQCPVQGTNQLHCISTCSPGSPLGCAACRCGSGDFRLSVRDDSSIEVRARNVVRRPSDICFRCLPSDFPQLAVCQPGPVGAGLDPDDARRWQAPRRSYTVIIDERGAAGLVQAIDRGVDQPAAVPNGGRWSPSTQGQFFGTPDDDFEPLDVRSRRGRHRHLGHRRPDCRVPSTTTSSSMALAAVGRSSRTRCETASTPPACPPCPGPQVARPATTSSTARFVELDASATRTWNWNSVDHFSPAETTFPQRFGHYRADPATRST